MEPSLARKSLFSSHFHPYPKPPAPDPAYKHLHAILAQSQGPCGDSCNASLSPSEVSLNTFIFVP